VWYLIGKLTGYELSLVAILIGWMVGKAVRWGSGHRGGWRYQVIAMLLTYLSIVSTYVPQLIESFDEAVAEDGVEVVEGSVDEQAAALVGDGAPGSTQTTVPAMAETVDDPLEGVSLGQGLVSLVLSGVFLLVVAMVVPFLAGFENIMGLIIIGIGLWEAWRQNRPAQVEVAGPFSLAPSTP
jgi:hypothetical protein